MQSSGNFTTTSGGPISSISSDGLLGFTLDAAEAVGIGLGAWWAIVC
jgi:hypothetical protein